MRKVHYILEKFTEVVFLLLCAVIIFSIFIFPHVFNMPDIYLVDTRIQPFFTGWTWTNGTQTLGFDLPYQIDVEKEAPMLIKNTIPHDLKPGDIIAFKSFMQSVIVHIDGKKVHEVGTDPNTFLGRDFGIFWVFIETLPEYAGKEIEISLFSHRVPFHGYVPEIFIGSRTGLLTHLFNQKGLWNFMSFTIVITGIITILVYVFSRANKKEKKGLLYLGAYVVTMGSWLLGESDILQFITRNPYYVTRISLLAILMCPVSIHLYIKESIPMKKRVSPNIFAVLAIIQAVISLLLEFFRILGITDLISISLAIILVTCVYYVILFLIEAVFYKNKRAQKEFFAISILCVFLLIEIIFFSLSGHKKTSYSLLIGMSIYILLMLAYQVGDYRRREQIKKEKVFFENMAYTDALTGACNRAKFKEHMKSIVATKGMAILQADTDRLKYINDNFSHFHGDQAIIRTYNILEKYLASIARIYRVGGDEFTIIIENYDKDTLDKIIEQIRQDAKAVHAQSDYDFSISIGIAEFDPSVDKNIYFTAIRADQQMYDDKKRLRKTVPQKFPVKKE